MEPVANGSTRDQNLCCWTDCFAQAEHHDLPLCQSHLFEAGMAWVRENLDILREVAQATPFPTLVQRERQWATERVEHARANPLPRAEGIVYYIQVRGSDRVKIGTTTNLRERMTALRADGPDLLATEPGGYDVEFRRHHQFADERYGRREEFALSDRLAAHIAVLAGA